jgi:RNA polymerase sigma-70 factor (ECF subfamily)
VADEETPSRVVSRAEEAARVHAALAVLPEHYRQVIILRNFELLPFEAIGGVMNRPSEAARALWGRAVRRLKEVLDAPPST